MMVNGIACSKPFIGHYQLKDEDSIAKWDRSMA